MKAFARLGLMGSSLGLILLTAAPSFADVTGTLQIGGTGTVTITPVSVTFNDNSTNNTSTSSSAAVSADSTLTYDSGTTLSVNSPILITPTTISPTAASTTGAYPVDVTLNFPSNPALSITITQIGPGSSNTNCAALTNTPSEIGATCSPLTPEGPSPIILVDDGPGGTTAILPVTGTATDGSGVSQINGSFSTPIPNETPAQLATATSFITPDAISGALIATPEPRALSLIVLAGVLAGMVVMNRRKGVA